MPALKEGAPWRRRRVSRAKRKKRSRVPAGPQSVVKAAKEQNTKASPAFSKTAVCRWHTNKALIEAGAETRAPTT